MPRETEAPRPRAESPSSALRREMVLRVSLGRLFAPESDPSVRFPDHSAEIEGFAFTPEGVTVALAVEGPHATILADEVWSGLLRRGQAVRRTSPHDERGRALLVMTVRTPVAESLVEMLRRSLLLPIEARQGAAELHLGLTTEDADALCGALRELGIEAAVRDEGALNEILPSEGLSSEDWGFLGLLCALHVFDGPVAPDAGTVARRLGIDPELFGRKVRTVEAGMKELVAGLFEPPGGPSPVGAAA
jgi:hypothetical protein